MHPATDPEGFVTRHHHRVRDAVSACGVPPAEVDSVAQEAFLVVCTPGHRIPPEVDPLGWTIGVARRLARQHLRATQRRRLVPLDAGTAADDLAPPTTGDADLVALRTCLDGLDPALQRLVLAYYVERRTADDLARGEGVSGDTLRHRLHRLRLSLAGCVRRRLGREDDP
jgi:RNA polymerase sigma-70 factor, ECF subfamily